MDTAKRWACGALIAAAGGPSVAATLNPAQALSTTGSQDVLVMDVDGTNGPDVVLLKHGLDEVWLNDGSGMLVDSGVRLGESDDYTISVAAADYDGDGDQDLLVGGFAYGARIYENQDGSFVQHQLVKDGLTHDWMLGDVNGDGYADLIAVDDDWVSVAVWFADGAGGGFAGLAVDSPDAALPLNGKCNAVATAELGSQAGNTGLELVAGCDRGEVDSTDTAGGVEVWHYDPDQGQFVSWGYTGDTDWDISDLAFADIDGDGDNDVLASHSSVQSPAALTGNLHTAWRNEGGSLASADQDFTGNGLAVGDFDGDGNADVVTGGYNHYFYAGGGAGTFASAEQLPECSSAQGAAAGDLDGDGTAEAVLAAMEVGGGDVPTDLVYHHGASRATCGDSDDDGPTSNPTDPDDGTDTESSGGGGGPFGPGMLLSGLALLYWQRKRS